jgi:molybdenum cofactor biosynthesis enzyme MoaA
MSEQVRYITNEQGERVGVLLDLETYNGLTHASSLDTDCLIGLNQAELQALAESMLAPAAQARLDELLAGQAESQLSEDELGELDHLLDKIDHLTLLKTRARYTLQSLENLTQAS